MNGKRALAWRNLMSAAIDVALERGLIDRDPDVEVAQCVFDFRLEGLPTIVGISDSGYGEVAVRVAVIPTDRARTGNLAMNKEAAERTRLEMSTKDGRARGGRHVLKRDFGCGAITWQPISEPGSA